MWAAMGGDVLQRPQARLLSAWEAPDQCGLTLEVLCAPAGVTVGNLLIPGVWRVP